MCIPAVEQWAERKEGVCVCNPAPDRVTLCRPRPVCPRPCGRATRHLRWPRGGAARNRTDHVIAANEQPTAWTAGQHRGRSIDYWRCSTLRSRQSFTIGKDLRISTTNLQKPKFGNELLSRRPSLARRRKRMSGASVELTFGVVMRAIPWGGGEVRAVTKTESLLCGCHF